MNRHAKASSAGSTDRQASGLGRIFGGVFATHGASTDAAGSGAPAAGYLRFAAVLGVLIATALLTLVLAAAPAHAAKSYGFLGAFCEPTGLGTPPCEPSFGSAAGMAVDPATGDLLVIDLEDQTLSRWHEDGTPSNFSALSGNVIDGHAGEADEVPAPEEILSGAYNETQVAVAPPGAASGTEGDIYVTDAFNGRIVVFDSSGEYLGQELLGFPCGVSVDSAGNVYVGSFEAEEGVYKLTPSAPATFTESPNSPFEASTPCQVAAGAGSTAGFVFAVDYFVGSGGIAKIHSEGAAEGDPQYTFSPLGTLVAVDPATGNVFAGGGNSASEVTVYDASGASEATPITTIEPGSAIRGVAVDGDTDHVYIARSGSENVEVFGPPARPEVTIGEVEGVTATTATFTGTVDPNGFATEWHFEYRKLGTATWTSTPSGDAGSGDSPVPVSLEVTGLASGATYEVRLLATNAGGTENTSSSSFTTNTSPPTIEQHPLDVFPTSATLQARINPNGLPTTYHFEWGTDASYGNRIPVAGERSIDAGSEPVTVQTNLSGLQTTAGYHFRVVATNPSGTTVGPDQPFETLGANGLPQNREYELVTPADKGPAASIADRFSGQQLTQAALDGSSFMYPLLNGLDSSTAGGWLRQRAERTDSGWLSIQVSGPSLLPAIGSNEFGVQAPSTFKFMSPDNSCALLESANPLSEDTPPASVELGINNLYRWSPDGEYELVSNTLPLNPALDPAGGGYYRKVDASDDCRQVFFTSPYELIRGASGLYEWDEGALRDAGLRPDGSVGASLGLGLGGAVPGGQVKVEGTARWNAVSPDGSRLFFTAIANEGPSSGTPAVFMREDGGAGVVEVSKSETGVATNGARFEAASADGGRVFFRANYGIDAEAGSDGPTGQACGPRSGETEFDSNPELEQKACDLYAYDVASGEIADLSADAIPADAGDGAQIQGLVGIDDDGSHAYFAALGQLIPGKGRTYAHNVAGDGSANVYLAQGGELSYVATLAEHGDIGDLLGIENRAGAALMRRAEAWAANVSADGGRLLFMSSRNLTGYETGGSDKFASYLYSADTGKLTCVSCRPDGLPLSAVEVPAEGIEPGYHQSAWLLASPQAGGYRARSLSEDGGLVVFTSPDALAPGAVEGKRNVYQWRRGQVTHLAVAEHAGVNGMRGYQDMSADGEDIFLASGERLAPHDRDFVSDIYDVRVDGGIPFSEPPPQCQVDDTVALEPNQVYCQAVSSPQPERANPATSGFVGQGNLSEDSAKNPCKRRARRARALSRRAKALRRRAKRATNPEATRRNANRARRAARAARRNSRAAKHCRRRARSANNHRGGTR